MTRIDFYVLATADARGRWMTACRLIEKAFHQGHRIYLKTASGEETVILDDLLWTFRQGSFVPHATVANAGDGDETPVLISHDAPPASMDDVLVNLGAELPAGFERFGRLAEIVDHDEARRQAGRARYKAYKDAGYAPETHRLDGGG
jgi:DNA polymerase-3 subunit chi